MLRLWGMRSAFPFPPAPTLRTPRLLLRGWREEDLEPFAQMNADPEVMEHFPAPMTPEQSAAGLERIAAGFREHGFGLWAVELPEVAPYIGFTGLGVPNFETPFTPCVEVGWRLARAHWGQGFATEAARAALAFGFEERGLEEIVSFTATTNRRSMAVMERLGMSRAASEDFDHPKLPADHRLQRHVLYRLRRGAFRSVPGDGPAAPAGP